MSSISNSMTLADWLALTVADESGARSAKVGVVGLGYVGLPLVLLLSEDRFRVTGFDIDAAKVQALNSGVSYIQRIEAAHISNAQAAGFHATTDFTAAASLDAILICVPTPLYPDHTPDMRSVVTTIEALAPHLRAGQLVVLESTTYPGTTEEVIIPTIEQHGNKVLRSSSSDSAQPLDGVMVAFSPEREDPGNVTTPRREIPKVVGGADPCATAAASALYNVLFARVVPMSTPAAAEMTKLLENIYRSVNIALVNELKQLCLAMDIDIWEVIAAASTKPFGFHAFQPGPGVGGHCIPVDPFYLSWKARQYGIPTRFIELAGEVNESMPQYVVQTTARALERAGSRLEGARLLILGVAYKRDIDDLRESPALTIIDLLRTAGANVSYNDPFLPHVGTGRHYDLRMESKPLVDLDQYDCVLIVADHSSYDYAAIITDSRLVIDTRNATHDLLLKDPGMSAKVVRC